MPRAWILVVEDDENIRGNLAEVFTGEGFAVRTAEHGQAALALLRASEELPALIFLDLMMPVLDGQAFLTEIQRRTENARFMDIPVVVVSAARQEVYGKLAGYLRKPPPLAELLEFAQKYLGATGGDDSAE